LWRLFGHGRWPSKPGVIPRAGSQGKPGQANGFHDVSTTTRSGGDECIWWNFGAPESGAASGPEQRLYTVCVARKQEFAPAPRLLTCPHFRRQEGKRRSSRYFRTSSTIGLARITESVMAARTLELLLCNSLESTRAGFKAAIRPSTTGSVPIPATCPLVQRRDRLCIDTDEIVHWEVRFLRARSPAFVHATLEPYLQVRRQSASASPW
jgi:hypothetical protein